MLHLALRHFMLYEFMKWRSVRWSVSKQQHFPNYRCLYESLYCLLYDSCYRYVNKVQFHLTHEELLQLDKLSGHFVFYFYIFPYKLFRGGEPLFSGITIRQTNTWWYIKLRILEWKLIDWNGAEGVETLREGSPSCLRFYFLFFLLGKRRCLSRWRQGENISVRWLRLAFLGWYKIKNFSRVHSLQVLVTGL